MIFYCFLMEEITKQKMKMEFSEINMQSDI